MAWGGWRGRSPASSVPRVETRAKAEPGYDGAMRPNKIPSGSNPDAKPHLKVIGMLVPYLREFPAHVLGAAACLVAAKVAGVILPLVLKHIVDHLDATKHQLLVVPVSLLLFYGGLRFANTLFGELRDVVFS